MRFEKSGTETSALAAYRDRCGVRICRISDAHAMSGRRVVRSCALASMAATELLVADPGDDPVEGLDVYGRVCNRGEPRACL